MWSYMYNLLEYSGDYSLTSGRWRNYYRVETGDVDDNFAEAKLFKYNQHNHQSLQEVKIN